MSGPEFKPSIDYNSPIYKLDIPPIAILLICLSGYMFILFIALIIRYFCRSKGICQNDLCQCGKGALGCCQCLEACTQGCTCETPTVSKCLDSCCPRRNLDFISIILCQCCGDCCQNKDRTSSDNCCNGCCCPTDPNNVNSCCGGNEGPCCSYGDLDCNCACVQPDTVNFCCCQIGTNYQRPQLDNE